ncbi:MAG: SatD family protein [Polaribacter sp.]
MTSVITGDIINSRNTSSKIWLQLLKEIFKELNAGEIYRGDSFQIEIEDVSSSLFTTIFIKSRLKIIKEIDVRMAIGIGSKNFDADIVTEANGEAFINSGYAFDHLLKKQTLAIKSPWKEVDEEINIGLNIGLLVMDHWTQNSAEFVKTSLEKKHFTQKEIAEYLNISQSSASERRKRAGFDEIMQLEKRYRKLINQKIAEI